MKRRANSKKAGGAKIIDMSVNDNGVQKFNLPEKMMIGIGDKWIMRPAKRAIVSRNLDGSRKMSTTPVISLYHENQQNGAIESIVNLV